MTTNNVINTSVPFSVPNGGTGNTTLTTPYGVLAAGTTATGPIQTIAPGTTGQVLTSAGASALPSFMNAPASLLSSATASGSSSVNFNNVFSGSSEIYLFVFENVSLSNSTDQVLCQFGTGSTPTYITTGYYENTVNCFDSSVGGINSHASITAMTMTSTNYSTSIFVISGYFYVFNVNQSTASACINGMANCYSDTPSLEGSITIFSHAIIPSANITSLRFIPGSSTISTGNFYLYGLAL